MAQELNAADVGRIGTGILGHMVKLLVDKELITLDEVKGLKDAVVNDSPPEKKAAVRAFVDGFFEVRD